MLHFIGGLLGRTASMLRRKRVVDLSLARFQLGANRLAALRVGQGR
jgi:hypothetical protein